MIVTAWRGGYTKKEADNPEKGGYGLKIPIIDRDQYFRREWDTIVLAIEGKNKEFEVNIDKNSFWGPKCRELIHKNIKQWFLEDGIAPWEKGKPPRIKLEVVSNNRFKASLYK